MDNAEILTLIKSALAEVAPKRASEFDGVSLNTSIESLGLDSIATMEMVGILEESADTTFPDEDLTNVNSLGDLAGLITKHGA